MPPPHTTAPPPMPLRDRTDDEVTALVRQAVHDGISAAVNDPETLGRFWSGAFEAAQAKATAETGRLVISGASAFARRVFWFLLFGFGVYQLGGWSSVAKLWASMFGPGGH